MGKKQYVFLFYLGLIFVLFFFGCQSDRQSLPRTNPVSPICVLENTQTEYQLRPFVKILEEPSTKYSIQDIIQPTVQTQFQDYPDHTLDLRNYQYYWGKVQIKNDLLNANEFTEWVLSFSFSWTDMEIFMKGDDGEWKQERNGTFTPDHLKKFAPTALGNLAKIPLPPNEVVTIYFRGINQQAEAKPSFYVRLIHSDTFYHELLKTKVSEGIFIGFILMMFLYNMILYFFGRDLSFIYYSFYLLTIAIYAAFMSENLSDWLEPILYPNHPEYLYFGKLAMYASMMFYLAFISSFLDLEQLLPRWNNYFKVLIWLGLPLIIIDIIILFISNFNVVLNDYITIPYILLVLVSCFLIVRPLYQTRDKKGYFIIAGIAAVGIGAFLTVVNRMVATSFSIFFLQLGTIIEIIIFSLGLAYRQRLQKQAKQNADFELKASQMIQEQNRLEADRLKELNDFKTRFYTNITHEFRTPLTVIMGMSDNLKNHPQEKKLIQRNSENLLRLVNQILDLSKLESGKLNLNLVHKDIIVYLQYLTESFYSNAMAKNIRLVFHSEEERVMMDYDEEKIQQIVYNLISNALKFTNESGKIIFHASQIEEEGQSILKLKIKDNGIGMSPENLELIFDRFYQGNHEVSNPSEGTGIGLSLTKELVELMKGRIVVESQKGKGTEFILYLPIKSEYANSTILLDGKKLKDQNHPSNIIVLNESQDDGNDETETLSVATLSNLLIIEDNPDIIIYIKSVLKNSYNIYTAKNGKLGIEKALDLIPDIIISDVMMPEKNGYEVCDILKQDERTSHIPIVLLTAKSTQSDKIDGLKHGADAYLTKPFDKEELLIRLEKLVVIRQQIQLRYSNNANTKISTDLSESIEDKFLQKLHEQIQMHLSDAQFGVPQLASATDMSQMQLYRKLKALTGKTPSQFIRSYRLHRALELLKSGELNVSEVAYDVGFSDPSYFSRMFHKEFGKNPSSFLKD